MDPQPNAAESSTGVEDRARKYRQAAVFYFAYGIYYTAGVLGLGERSGWRLHGMPRVAAWIFIPLGLLIAVGFAYVVWRQVRWFTIVLAVAVFLRSAWLFTRIENPLFLGPFLVSAAAAWMLARAGWDL